MPDVEDSINPKSLYKYCRIDKYCLSIFVTNEIYLSMPTDFNDPFDSMWSFLPIKSDKEVVDHLQKISETSGEEPPSNLSTADIKKQMNDILEKAQKTFQGAGLYCMSTDPTNMLMWSHYADQHRGICIEFDRTDKNNLGSNSCAPVEYVDPILIVKNNFDFFNNTENFMKEIMYTKFKHWDYEKEWRLVYFPSGSDQMNRNKSIPGDIKSVIFGVNTSVFDINLVSNTLALLQIRQNKEIDLFKINLNKENGTLQCKKISRTNST